MSHPITHNRDSTCPENKQRIKYTMRIHIKIVELCEIQNEGWLYNPIVKDILKIYHKRVSYPVKFYIFFLIVL